MNYYEFRDELKNLLGLYNKEKRKNKVYTEILKQNENRAKIKTCMTHNLPDNAEIICMIREDFERNFGNDYVNKDKKRIVVISTHQNLDNLKKNIKKDYNIKDFKFINDKEKSIIREV